MNRITNFLAPYSLIYLNWYAGEASTAVIVANAPHIWPLISHVFGLGTFKRSTGNIDSNSYPFKSHRSAVETQNSRTRKFDAEGYIPTGSEENLAQIGDKDVQWGYIKSTDSSQLSSGEVDTNNSYLKDSVRAGSADSAGIEHGIAQTVENPDFGRWQGNSADPNKHGRIVKTIHINQHASDL